MSTATVPPEVAAYLDAVREALRDLPPAEREDLVAEVEASLIESASEGGAIAARLGPPEEFAAELRAAAGFHPQARTPRESPLASRVREATARVRLDPRARAVARLAHELAPIWWVLRAYFAVGAFAYAIDAEWSTRYPIVPRLGSGELGLFVIALAAVLSIWLGLLMRRDHARFGRVAATINALLVLAAVPTLAEVTNSTVRDAFITASIERTGALEHQVSSMSVGLWNGGVRVDNIYPYSRDGKLLHDVLLFDGAGRPLEIPSDRATDANRRFVVTNGNRPLFNVFPIRYYEPGTRRVERPNATPYVELPFIVTPPLPKRRQVR